MNKVFTLIAASLLMTACGSKKQAEITFDVIGNQYVEERDVDLGDSVDYAITTVTYNFNFQMPTACKNAKLLSAVQQNVIANTCGEKYAKLAPSAAVDSFASDMQQMEVNGPEGLFESHSEMLFYEENLLHYAVERTSYTGGAHGLTTVNYFTFGIAKLQELHYSDIFDKKDSAAIAGLLMGEVDKLHQQNADFEIFKDDFFLTDNLRFNRDGSGLTFYYNPYEIAAYAVGPVELTIPYATLLPFVKADSPVKDFIKAQTKK